MCQNSQLWQDNERDFYYNAELQVLDMLSSTTTEMQAATGLSLTRKMPNESSSSVGGASHSH